MADIETMGDKFRQLAEAFDESQYDWRPMEDVRSVREVLGLAIAEANLFPTAWATSQGRGPRPDSVQSSSGLLRSGDMHEHLGQLIAYERTNHIVPPWSMGN